MFEGLYIAATGMQAQQLSVDTVANNLANVNTPAFKRGRVTFTDLMLQDAAARQVAGTGEAGLLASAPPLGAGVGIASVGKVFEAGEMRQTGSPLDLAIRGDGFLAVTLPDGTTGYTRSGSLRVNADGLLVTEAGYPLQPGITVPADATGIAIDAEGTVQLTLPNQQQPLTAGRLELVRFTNPAGLTALGNNVYTASETSGEAIAARPGEDGVGGLAQGYLEGSNVKLVDEMVNLMVAQRAYEANVKVIQAADEMLGLVNGLRK
ncbi:MAG: flagellar basal-body rod protein FlgG [Anaeromyxobacter sp.]